MRLLSIKDIMSLYGVGRPTATAWAQQSGASITREKWGTYRVDQDKLEAWLKRRTK